MKFACVICTHNPDRLHISAQIYSILRSGKIDIFLFDFDSPPEIQKFLEKLCKRFGVTFVDGGQALGPKFSFLHALRDSRLKCYDYIFLADQDDVWKKEKFYIVKAVCEIYQPELMYHDVEVFDHNKRLGSYYSLKNRKLKYERDKDMLVTSNIGIGHTFCISNHLLFEFNNCKLSWHAPMHDWEILLFCIKNAKLVKYIDLRLSYYRIHDNNVIGIGDKTTFKFRSIIEYIFLVDAFSTRFYVHKRIKILAGLFRVFMSTRVSLKRFAFELILLFISIVMPKGKN